MVLLTCCCNRVFNVLQATFFIFRVLSLPALVYVFYADMQAKPTKTIGKVNQYYAMVGAAAVAGIWMLSCYWFALITKGLLSTIFPGKSSKEE
jgi:hypothetical protein